MDIVLRPRKVALCFGLAVAGLTIANLFVQYCKFALGHETVYGLVDLFDVGKEANLPSTYSAFALMFCSLLLAFIGLAKKADRQPYRWHWLGLAALFFFLAFDEGAVIHEKLIVRLREAYHLSGWFYFGWIIPYGIAAVVIGFAYLRFLFRGISGWTRVRFIVAAAVYLTGALVLEMAGGRVAELYGGDEMNPIHAFYYSIEEFLEMAGILLFIHALVVYIHTELKGLRITVGTRSAGAEDIAEGAS